VSAAVNPGYTSEPAPLGLSDLGLSATPYSYNTSHILGQITFNTPPNATQPGATGVTLPVTGADHLGYVGSLYEFGIQLNTVATNISFPGSNAGFFWTQNVLNVNDTGIHFVDDTFNMTAAFVPIEPGTLLSGCNNNSAGAQGILDFYGGVFQCVGGTIPVSPASYPVTIELYNNATTNSANESQVAYGYRIIESGTGQVFTGISDTVVFNNPNAAVTPPNTYTAPLPGFSIDGFAGTLGGVLRDAEIVLVGGIGGDNAMFRSLNGTLNLEYSNASSGGWQNVPSAYNFGADTGETSAGIADYWTPSHTLEVNQGPSMLYGLWNAAPWASVGSGDIQVSGSVSPSYAFVFLGNLAPDVYGDNLSWFPTTSSGSFNTYLPPLGAPWTTAYYTQAFAAGSAEVNGSAIVASTTTYTLTLPLAPGVIRAPIYMFSNAQAASLAANVTGSSTAPYDFNGLTISMNFTFNHLNDYKFPSFEMFMSQGVTTPFDVNNTYQGPDTTFGTYYFYDSGLAGSTGLLTPPAAIIPLDWSGMTGQIDIFGGVGDHVSNETVETIVAGQGSSIVLWGDTNAVVSDITSLFGSSGVWVGRSYGTTVMNAVALAGANAITEFASWNTVGWNLLAEDSGSFAVNSYGSTGGTFSWVNASFGGLGFYVGQDFGPFFAYYDLPGNVGDTVNWFNATSFASPSNITFSSHMTFNHFSTYDPSNVGVAGIWLDGDFATTFNTVTVSSGNAWGIDMWNGMYTNITNYVLENLASGNFEVGSIWEYSDFTTVNGFTVSSYPVGVESLGLTNTVFTNANVTNATAGAEFLGATTTSISNVNASYPIGLAGFALAGSTGVTLNNILGYGAVAVVTETTNTITATGITGTYGIFGWAVILETGSGATVTGLTASEFSGALALFNFDQATVTTGTGTQEAIVVNIEDSSYDSVSGITVSMTSEGVEVGNSHYITVTNVTASDPSTGVYVDLSTYVSVTTVTASDQSIGVEIVDSQWVSVSTVTLTNMSVGVFSQGSLWTAVSGVTASNTTMSSPWADGTWDGLPAVAAVVTYNDQLDSIFGVAAMNYPAAYYDHGSYDPGVNSVNGTGSMFAVILNDTYYGVFSNIGAFHDWVGVEINLDGSYNVFTMSNFVDSTSYGVAIYSGYDNMFYENNFVGNNGATTVYNAAHIQAFASSTNYFDADSIGLYVGNYWADWHTYNSYGQLAPYPVPAANWDYYPIGGPEGTVAIYFEESGLTSGASWSVTFNGATQSTSAPWLVFYAFPGTYAFTVPAVMGYSVTPGSGSVTAVGTNIYEYLAYTAQYNVTVTETGLLAGTSWSATVGGVTLTGTNATLTFHVGSGTYAYQITPVAGYIASPSSGSILVGTTAYDLSVTFTAVTYAVTVTEDGLSTGTSWSATVNGVTQNSVGTSITFYLPNGTYTFKVANVSGYSETGGSGSLTVSGSATGVAVGFTPKTTASTVSTDTFNMWLAVAIAVAVIALVLGLLALFLRRRNTGPQSGASPASAGSTDGTSGGSGTWNEGSGNQ